MPRKMKKQHWTQTEQGREVMRQRSLKRHGHSAPQQAKVIPIRASILKDSLVPAIRQVVHGLIDADIGARSLDESEVRALRKLGEMCNQYTPTSRRIDAA